MNRALKLCRLDLVKLLVEHGFDPKSVDMMRVFDTWNPDIMTYFIELGADVESGRPFAYALSNRIRTALGIYKRYRSRYPSIDEQANIALRYHCQEGNTKWISLLLWAGADPYTPGADSTDRDLSDDDEGLSALGYAALYEHYEIFEMRRVQLDPADVRLRSMIRYLGKGKGADVLKKLLERGMSPNDQEDGGCSAIPSYLNMMTWYNEYIARDTMRAIHLLAKHGAKWIPSTPQDIREARRLLLQLEPDFTLEFVWIMAKYQACDEASIRQLLGTPSIKSHTKSKSERLMELVESWRRSQPIKRTYDDSVAMIAAR